MVLGDRRIHDRSQEPEPWRRGAGDRAGRSAEINAVTVAPKREDEGGRDAGSAPAADESRGSPRDEVKDEASEEESPVGSDSSKTEGRRSGRSVRRRVEGANLEYERIAKRNRGGQGSLITR